MIPKIPADDDLSAFLHSRTPLSALAESSSAKHGLTPWLCQTEFLAQLDEGQQQRIRAAFARERLHDEQQAIHLARLSEAFSASNLYALVIKGAALARQVYPQLGLRAKGDLDVWVPFSQLAEVRRMLFALGYRSIPCNFGRFSQPEQSFIGADAQNPVKIDLHWEVSSRPLLARAFSFESIWHASVKFGFGSAIRAPNLPDALLIAVIHRVGHHRENERWIWLKDIDLLWRALTPEQRIHAFQQARAKGVSTLLHEALVSTAAIFQTPIQIDREFNPQAHELSARLLDARTSLLWFDFKSLNWPDFFRLCGEHAFPPMQFMQHRFGQHPQWQMPWFYAKRWISSMRS
jgi:Uncharacterised nucleotidyltransferase